MTPALVLIGLLLAVCGCAGPGRPQASPGASRLGVPRPAVDEGVVNADAAPPGGPSDGMIRLPERITLPATYRLILVDGHMSLVREADAQSFETGPSSLRIVTGEVARGELAYQPGLLPQELAAEVAASRESAARMDNALEVVMRRSRELSEQASALEAQGRKLAELLAAAQARERAPGAAGPPSPSTADPRGP